VKKSKKIFIFLCLLSTIILFMPKIVFANQNENDLIEQLEASVQSQLDVIDFATFDRLMFDFDDTQMKIFGNNSFEEKVKSILNGNFVEDGQGFLQAFFSLLFSEITSLLPVLASIAITAILCGLVSQIKSGFMSDSTSHVVFFVCFSVVVLLSMSCITHLVDTTVNTVSGIKNQINVAFPVLLALMAGIGGAMSVKAYQPSIALLSGGIIEIVSNIILPLFICTTVFSVVDSLSNSVRLTKLTSFFKSATMTVLIVSFTIFTAFLSIQGLTASSFDGISIRAAKFATKAYIPILGGYLSDGFDLIMSSSILIKNSVGVAGLFVLICTILSPILQILGISLGFKIVSAVIEPVTDVRITRFLSAIAKHLNVLIAAILAVAFMYFICVMLVIFTSNAFF